MLLGFDIGGTKCAVVLGRRVEEEIAIVAKEVLPTSWPALQMVDALFRAAETLMSNNAITREAVQGIGISCGGPLSSKMGIILSPPNLPGWDNILIVRMVAERFGKEAVLQNDANACAVAEWKYGAGKGYNNLIFLTFGTGMGAGLILNGGLYAGTSDLAGEVGHIRLAADGPVGFGKAGSFEGFCSGGGIAQLAQARAREILLAGGSISFCQSVDELSQVTAKSVAAAAFSGDKVAADVYKTSAQYLGAALATMIDVLNPEVIILGSIYCRAQSLIEPWMRAVVEREVLPAAYEACSIVPAALGDSIGDVAALALADMCC